MFESAGTASGVNVDPGNACPFVLRRMSRQSENAA